MSKKRPEDVGFRDRIAEGAVTASLGMLLGVMLNLYLKIEIPSTQGLILLGPALIGFFPGYKGILRRILNRNLKKK